MCLGAVFIFSAAFVVYCNLLLYSQVAHRWFNQYEPSVSCCLLFVLVVPALLATFLTDHALSSKMTFSATYAVFFMTLFTSIVGYRLSPFHPLARYPGPIVCKVSQLWTVVINSSGKAHHYRKLLHDQYGPIVRIGMSLHVSCYGSADAGQGPNELSVTDKDMFPYILGSQGMPRGPCEIHKYENNASFGLTLNLNQYSREGR